MQPNQMNDRNPLVNQWQQRVWDSVEYNIVKEGDKMISGMSIVGNHEAPKSLVIVPWKSSELGTELDVSRALDDERGQGAGIVARSVARRITPEGVNARRINIKICQLEKH